MHSRLYSTLLDWVEFPLPWKVGSDTTTWTMLCVVATHFKETAANAAGEGDLFQQGPPIFPEQLTPLDKYLCDDIKAA